MSETQVAAIPTPPDLPCDPPAADPSEPAPLKAYRDSPGDERLFIQARRGFRDAQDWPAMAKLLMLHAAAIDKASKAAELALQAAEIWIERVKSPELGAHALAIALEAQPDNPRAYERLHKLYRELGWEVEFERLLQWRIMFLSLVDPTMLPHAHVELAEVYETETLALSRAVHHYKIALRLDPTQRSASERLIDLYLGAGAWGDASQLMNDELQRLDPNAEADRICELQLRLARIETDVRNDIAAAARHLQAAIKAKPDSLEALRGFGVLYLGSGKASQDGMQKAAGIFYKAGELAHRQGDLREATRLFRRTLSLRPGDPDASNALEGVLTRREHWMELDDLYAEMLTRLKGPAAVDILLRRARLLEERLERREEARVCYELARLHQGPDGYAWEALERIYSQTADWHALAGLLEYAVEAQGANVDVPLLLRAAAVYRDHLDDDERAATFYYMVLEREPFNGEAFEGYKEHFRRKHNWAALRDLILYQIDQAFAAGEHGPIGSVEFVEEFVELADICERRLGDVDGAVEAWSRLAEAYPRDPRPKQQIGRIQKRNRMWDNMLRVQEAELERTSDPQKRVEILKRLTQIYRDRMPDPTRAIELYQEILSIRPDDVQSKRALTALYDRAADYPSVIHMLREQYDRSKSNTERVNLLRRMAELWHDEESVQDIDSAAWACEQILELTPRDAAAHHRLQLLHQEAGNFEGLLLALERELEVATSKEQKVGLLRRMARVAEEQLQDRERGAELWAKLLELEPSNLEFADRMVAVYESHGRYDELADLLERVAQSPKTPQVRQLDYYQRLGALAHVSLEDPQRAREAYERVLQLRDDHRGAAQAIVDLSREQDDPAELCAALERLQHLVDSDEEADAIAWERSGIAMDPLGNYAAAATALRELADGRSRGNPHVNARLLEVYKKTGARRELIGHAELMLLGTSATDERRQLYDVISKTWLEVGEKAAALSAFSRFVGEFSDDDAGLVRLAELQEQTGEHAAALDTLGRRLKLNDDPLLQLETIEAMARIADEGIGDVPRTVELLDTGFQLDPLQARLDERLESMAERHDAWDSVLPTMELRITKLADFGADADRIALARRAADIARTRLDDPDLAFEWTELAFFMPCDEGTREALEDQARELSSETKNWDRFVTLLEHKLDQLQLSQADRLSTLDAAAEVCDVEMKAPARAIAFLRRALEIDPSDEPRALRAQTLAEGSQDWTALLELHQFALAHADSNLARFDAYAAMAKVHETHLDDPPRAFAVLRGAWDQIRGEDGSLAEEALDLALDLAKRHGLWSSLAQHHLARGHEAFAQGDASQGIDFVLEAARTYDEQVQDALGAMRALFEALAYDPELDVVLPRIREYGEALDASQDELAGAGALVELRAIAETLHLHELDEDVQLSLLERRAVLREQRLDDAEGAMTEWARVLSLAPENGRAAEELERIAGAHSLWGTYLWLPAWRREQSQAKDAPVDEEIRELRRLAELYEEKLKRNAHAMRARMQQWRLEPIIPERVGELDGLNEELWRLAGMVGVHSDPELPKDPHLRPELVDPEAADTARWLEVGVDAETLKTLDKVAAPNELDFPHTAELSDIGAVLEDEGNAIATPLELPVEQTQELEDVDELEEIEEIEEIEELDFDELEGDIVEVVDTAPAPPQAPPTPAPPKLPFDPARGLPAIPQLTQAVVPSRPALASAWAEIEAMYVEHAAADIDRELAAHLASARLWDEGADDVEAAFRAHERALLTVPEDESALESLQDLAARRDARGRLIQAYAHLLNEAALPEHVVALGLRIAALHELDEAWEDAERRYRGVLAVQPENLTSLGKLADIFEAQERWSDYADVFSRRLNIEARELTEDEHVTRTLHLATIYETKLDTREKGIDVLRVLAREFPGRPEIWEQLVRLLLDNQAWAQAIEAMKTSIESTDDDAMHAEFYASMAEVYETKLELPDRAIDAWQVLADKKPDDPRPFDALARLFEADKRWDDLLPVLDARLAQLPDDPTTKEARTQTLIVKARALREGKGDEAGALTTLEQLSETAPDNDEVSVNLANLYVRVDRVDDALTLLRRRLGTLPADEDARRRTLSISLARLLSTHAKDPEAALEVVEKALSQVPKDAELLRVRVEIARQAHDLRALVQGLSDLSDPDGHLEAAELARTQLGDPQLSSRLFGRVLADAKAEVADPRAVRRQFRAIEGLVQLRIDDNDTAGAIQFMDRQLEEVEDPSVKAKLLTEIGRITHRTTKDSAASRARFEAALELDSALPGAQLGLGEIALADDDLVAAEKHFEAAVEAYGLVNDSAGLVEALVGLAKVLERGDRAGEAYRRLNTALRHDPENLGIRTAVVRNRFEARRWRDVITAADKLEQWLEEQDELDARSRRLAGTIFTYAAKAERELRHGGEALVKLERALQVDPDNGRALAEYIPMLQERGDHVKAAEASLRQAELAEELHDRARASFAAGLSFHQAATAARADAEQDEASADEQEFRKRGFAALRRALTLVADQPASTLEREQLETALRIAAGTQPDIALDSVDRLLQRTDISDELRLELQLEGARLAPLTGRDADANRDLELARAAVETAPTSADAISVLADALAEHDQSEELERVVEAYFERVPTPEAGASASGSQFHADAKLRRMQVRLLLRLADLRSSQPERAVETYERALAIDPEGLDLESRRALGRHYSDLGYRLTDKDHGPRMRRNLDAMLELDPLDTKSLAILAEDCRYRRDLDRADALYRVILLREPENEAAKAFFESHSTETTDDGELNLELLESTLESDAGVPDALFLVWEGGAKLLAPRFAKVEVDGTARVSPMGKTPLARSWSEVLKHVGQTKVALFNDPKLAGELCAEGELVHLCCQNPPMLVASEAASQVEDEAMLRFAVARALYLARPESILVAGLARDRFNEILDATLLAFHPRHTKRKSSSRGSDSETAKLAQEFTRKLPIRVSRQIGTAFKEATDDSFDTRAYRKHLSRVGNRVGLAMAGDLEAALRVLLGTEPNADVGAALQDSDEARELVAFALSQNYVKVRKSMGLRVTARD